MREIRRYLLCFALLSCGIAAAAARSLTDSELATLHGPDIPNIDLRVASLLTLVDQPCDAVPLVRFLQSRDYAAAFPQIREMYLRAANTYGDCNANLMRAFAQFHTAAASQAMAQRVRWLTDQPPGPPRDAEIDSTLALLGAEPLEAQCDMTALERDVMSKPLSPSFKDKLRARFDEGRTILARLNEMSPDDLAEWVMRGRDDILRSSIQRGADVNAVATSRANFNGGMTLLNLAITRDNGKWRGC